jgi:hypothetical protein
MSQLPNALFPSVPSLLEALREAGTPIPENLSAAVQQLNGKIQNALRSDEALLGETLQALFPEIWQLRLAAFPFLTEMEITGTLHQVELDLNTVASKAPQLKGAVERLNFGINLMIAFLKPLLKDAPDYFEKLTNDKTSAALDYQDIIAQIGAAEKEQAAAIITFLEGSLMMELLLFALCQIDKDQPAPATAMCHELQYLSAEAVKQYAAGLGIDHTELPWYRAPKSYFQDFLLAGPIATTEQRQFIKEKRAHFNTWK